MTEYTEIDKVLSIIENMQEEHHYDAANLEDRYVVAHLLEVADKIKKLKAADVQPVKHGRWVFTEKLILGNPYGSYKCSECMYHVPHEDNYCPNCGARMGGDTNG